MLLEGASAKQQAAPLTAAALTKLPRWRKVDPLVKSYLGNTLHLLGEGAGGAPGASAARLAGCCLQRHMPPCACMPAPDMHTRLRLHMRTHPAHVRTLWLQSNPRRRSHFSGAARSRRQPRANSEGLYLAALPARAAVAAALSCGHAHPTRSPLHPMHMPHALVHATCYIAAT